MDESGDLQQEPIRLHAGGGWVESNDNYFDLIPTELSIPFNLFVSGTVNIDESTYMFSPKVLDRANVIELNTVDIENYGSPDTATGRGGTFLLKEFPKFNTLEIPNRNHYLNLDKEVRKFLCSVHKILSKHQLHFGYRVINEISAYINNAQKYCEPSPKLLAEATDFQMIQKILPKLSGSQSILETPIRDLLTILTATDPDTPMEHLLAMDFQAAKYPRSVDKLQRMARKLVTQGFANYID